MTIVDLNDVFNNVLHCNAMNEITQEQANDILHAVITSKEYDIYKILDILNYLKDTNIIDSIQYRVIRLEICRRLNLELERPINKTKEEIENGK